MVNHNIKTTKIIKNLYNNNKGLVFNFFKFDLNISDKNFSLNIWNFSSFFSVEKINVNCLSVNYIFFNYLKHLYIINKPARSSIYIFDRSILSMKLFLSFYYLVFRWLNKANFAFNHGWLYRLNFIGIGYKVFLYKDCLYLKLGYCRIIKVDIPHNISIFCRKRNRILLVANNYEALAKFVFKLKSLREFNFYKGKGIFELTNFDNIKLKVGKQQQFY